MRERYDSEKRKQRYAENREEIRNRERANYKKRKEESARKFYTGLLDSQCATDDARTKIKAFIDSEGYKADTKRMREYWAAEVRKIAALEAITHVTLEMTPDL